MQDRADKHEEGIDLNGYELEILSLLIISLLFSLAYLFKRHSKDPYIWAGIIGSMSWIILGLVFFVGRALAGSETYVIGMLFNGIGIIFIILWMIDLLNIGKWKKELGEVEIF